MNRSIQIFPITVVVVACFLIPSAWSQQTGIQPEDYYQISRAGDPRLSPDGRRVLYVVSTPDAKQKTSHSDIWLAYVDGSHEPRRLTYRSESASSPRWAPDGKTIAFLSKRPLSAEEKAVKKQVQLLSLNGGEAEELTHLKNGVDDFSWSPDGTKLVCVSTWGPTDTAPPDVEQSDIHHYVHPTYKWNGRGFIDDHRQHIWVVDVKSGSAKQITDGDEWNDSKPQWSPDGTRIAFLSDRSGRLAEDVSHTRPSIWVIGVDGGTPVNISGEEEGAIGVPQWSLNGEWIAYFSRRFEEDPPRLLLAPTNRNAKTKQVAADLDLSVEGLKWGSTDRALYFLSNVRGGVHLFRADVSSGQVSQVTSGDRTIADVDIANTTDPVVYVASDFQHPGDLYFANLDGTQEKQLTQLNATFLQQRQIQPLERVSYRSNDGFLIDGFLVKPVGWQAGKSYPMILYIHGGPEGMFGNAWLMRAQTFAARGWAVFYTNPRGSTGYGTNFMSAVVKEWGGKVFSDLMTGVDTVLNQNRWIDPNRLGVTGASFGGFMTNWIITQTTRFSAAVPMASISDYVSDEGARDDYYGHAHDFGGDLFQNFDLYWKYSPIRYAMNAKTPTLILHGDADQRVPLGQAEEWFRALHHFKVPSELVIFPRESHTGLSDGEPKHVVEALKWQIYWFERYLNGNTAVLPPDVLKKTD